MHGDVRERKVGARGKSHAGQQRATDKARYTLVISISAPGQKVDLYSEVTALVEAKEIEVPIG